MNVLKEKLWKNWAFLSIQVNLLKLYGAIELAPLTGISDIICDLTATGASLKENNLSIIDTLFDSTAWLIANPVSLRIHYNTIQDIVIKLNKWINNDLPKKYDTAI